MNHKREEQLDQILEGVYPADHLSLFWQWLKIKMTTANPNLDEYWNMYYLQHMRDVFFESCVTHPKYQKFYVNNLMALDGKRTLPQQFLQDQQQINLELIQRLQEQLTKKDLPQTLQDEINLIITKLTHEAEEAQKANE